MKLSNLLLKCVMLCGVLLLIQLHDPAVLLAAGIEITHNEENNLKNEILSAIEKGNINPLDITEIAIRGNAALTYEDCRSLVTTTTYTRFEENLIQQQHLDKKYNEFLSPGQEFPEFDKPAMPAVVLPASILLNLKILNLKNAVFEGDYIPDTLPGRLLGAFERFSNLEKVVLPDKLVRI
ncbi:MAG: hypothetical protein LBL73_07645, partial [Synergistaceae bacterium]|nr:hypothetical protein [Synergistaceae bacterium]